MLGIAVLFIQDDVADRMISMLTGAMAELVVGDPRRCRTDVGPVIDQLALDRLRQHQQWLDANARLLYRVPVSGEANGLYFSPWYELTDASAKGRGVWSDSACGTLSSQGFRRVIDTINGFGYGLTFGVHSRIQSSVTKL